MSVDPWDAKPTATFLCLHCGFHSHGTVLATHYFREEVDGDPVGPDYRYRLLACTKCHDTSLMISIEIAHNVYDDEAPVYPATHKSSSAVPDTLRRCFDEANQCHRARAYTATAIMCRRVLELLAADRGIKERNLAASLASLRDQGHIDARLFEWCDALRLAGNDAAHEVHLGVSALDAKDMRDLVEAVLDYVYVFQARYQAFQARRAKP